MALTHAILARLIDTPLSGYDLAQQFDGSVGYFWAASHQQIYRELSKLEQQGWIAGETVLQTGKPDKKLYYVTEIGKQQLKSWMAEPSEPSPIKDDLLVKIFAGYLAPQAIAIELKRHQKAHQEKLAVYKAIEQKYFSNPQILSETEKFQYLTLLNGISYETHWLSWLDRAIELLK
ncbi:MAG: hypothetical protein N4J56_003754 [Chroococcidiopsis sp. SAG 2025]|uniref:PadR family transcriptional regulator n=1 Tax=Chroococcidiopsis sp. SAG 2025 TaxID=171389 RepID=UPI0029371D1A|nr:PadR family transcriptional regulator [Chroococcidiopsis sp. SAG 2025]MDV2994100.1 hypothetical protein [Chroococcidiopsis sp. SAG 2025]